MLAHWITAAPPPPEHTFYAGVRQLPAGSLLELPCAPGAPARPFWLTGGAAPPLRAPRAELVAGLRDRLQSAVRRRLPPAGPAGIMLSGGLDSSSVGAFAARDGSAPLTAYSAVFPRHASVDEGALIDRLTEAYGIPGVKVSVRTGGVVSGAVAYLERWHLPPVSPNLFFWQPLLERARDDGVAVMLDGEGGDELFGFDPYLLADYVRRGRLLAAARTARRGMLGDAPPGRVIGRVLWRFGAGGALPYPVHQAVRRRRGVERYTPSWLTADAARMLFDHQDEWEWKRARGPRWRAHFRWRVALVGSSIGYEHIRLRAAQAGLRARHPLADVDVVEYLLRLPPELAYDPHLSRPLQREAVAGLVPDEVRLRPAKSFFDAVFHEAVGERERALVRHLLCGPRLELGSVVHPERVRAVVDATPETFPGGRRAWSIYVWRMTTAELWLRQHAGQAPAEALRGVPIPQPACDLVAG
jgi:asparagine synthase (glutamine-hydrolysing)